VITAKLRVAVIKKATANRNAKQVCEEINNEVGHVSYATVLRIIKAAGIDLTTAASERMKRRRRDPTFAARQAAAASNCMRRLHADPEFEAKRIAGIRNAKAKRHTKAKQLDPA
jgi:hypothetical protein